MVNLELESMQVQPQQVQAWEGALHMWKFVDIGTCSLTGFL